MSERQDSIAPPPLPSEPVAVPLAYAHAGVTGASNRGRQFAKASWVAPLIALLVLWCIGTMNPPKGSAIGIFLSLLALGLLLAGFGLGIVALTRIRRWGRGGVLAPAIVGVSLSGLFLVWIAILVPSIFAAKRVAAQQFAAQAAAARQAQLAQIKQSAEQAFLSDGWMGALNDGEVILTITVIPSDSSLATDLNSELPGAHRFAIVAVRNHSGEAITVDTRRAILYFNDNTHEPAPDPVAILSSAMKDRAGALSFAPPYTIEARRDLTKGILFFPEGTNFDRLEHVTIYLNGHATEVPGRIYSATEKKLLHEASKRAEAGN